MRHKLTKRVCDLFFDLPFRRSAMTARLDRQPLKALYLSAAVAWLLVMLPVWTLIAIIPSWRPRRSWTLSRTVTVWSARYLLPVAFRTRTFSPLMVDPHAMAKDPANGLVWVEPEPNLVVGEIKAYAEKQGVETVRLAGYWYGQRDEGAVGTMAKPGERVIYELHGKQCHLHMGSSKPDGHSRCFRRWRMDGKWWFSAALPSPLTAVYLRRWETPVRKASRLYCATTC